MYGQTSIGRRKRHNDHRPPRWMTAIELIPADNDSWTAPLLLTSLSWTQVDVVNLTAARC